MNAAPIQAIALTLNGLDVVQARFLFAWKGVWLADVELNLDTTDPTASPAPTGKIALVVGTSSLSGIVDPRFSGTFSNRTFVRVVGGAGAWDSLVLPKQFVQQGGGLSSTQVYADTAQAIGELPPVDPNPVIFGINDPRMAGPAREIFGDRDWYVDPITGVANVAPWPTATADESLQILDFDPIQQIGHLACEALVLPGTVLDDPRFNGVSPVVRTVEQVFDHHGSQVTVWCAAKPVERLQEAFTIAVRVAADTAHLKVYQYRFVLTPSGTDLALQAITPGAPDLNPISQYQSLSGTSNKYAPSTVILVGFTGDTPPQPYLVTASPLATPLQTTIDATTIKIGPTAATNVVIGAGDDAPALASIVDQNFQAIVAYLLTLFPSAGTCTLVASVSTGTITGGGPGPTVNASGSKFVAIQ